MRRIVSTTAIILLVFSLSGDIVLAKNATLKQQILPLDCIFEEVNDGLGTIHYLTPEACGVIIPPTVEPTLPPAPSGSGQITPQLMPVLGRTPARNSVYRSPTTSQSNPGTDHENGLINVILLNNIGAALQNGGYVVMVHIGSTFFYRPLDNPQTTVRSLTVTGIDAHKITLSVQQINLKFNLGLGQARTFDKLRTSQPAIGVRLESLDAPSSAELRVQLLNIRPVVEHNASVGVQLWLLFILLLVLIGARSKPEWFGGKRHI
jgi:hypothetical protein